MAKGMRGHNEGSIYRRKDGRWVGAINLRYQGGKLRRKCHYAKTPKEISDWLTEELAKFNQGAPDRHKAANGEAVSRSLAF